MFFAVERLLNAQTHLNLGERAFWALCALENETTGCAIEFAISKPDLAHDSAHPSCFWQCAATCLRQAYAQRPDLFAQPVFETLPLAHERILALLRGDPIPDFRNDWVGCTLRVRCDPGRRRNHRSGGDGGDQFSTRERRHGNLKDI